MTQNQITHRMARESRQEPLNQAEFYSISSPLLLTAAQQEIYRAAQTHAIQQMKRRNLIRAAWTASLN